MLLDEHFTPAPDTVAVAVLPGLHAENITKSIEDINQRRKGRPLSAEVISMRMILQEGANPPKMLSVTAVKFGTAAMTNQTPPAEITVKVDDVVDIKVSFIKPLVAEVNPGMWKQLETGSRAYQEKQFRDVIGDAALAVSPARPLKTYKFQDTWVHQELIPDGRLTAAIPVKELLCRRPYTFLVHEAS